MNKKIDKTGHAAHIKNHTIGTSNEISFSILDAARNRLDGEEVLQSTHRTPRVGRIAMFTLSRGKKQIKTPTKEKGLTLSNGAFVSAEDFDRTNIVPLKSSRQTKVSALSSEKGSKGGSGVLVGRVLKAHLEKSSRNTLSRTSEEEIARRKKRRRRERIFVALVHIAAGLGVAVMGGIYLYINHEIHIDQINQLNQSLDLIRSADNTIVDLDNVVEDPFSASSLTATEDILKKLDDAHGQLEQANELSRTASSDLPESKDKEAANQAVSAVTARLALIDSGKDLLNNATQVEEAAKESRKAWDKTVQADDLARAAASLVFDTTVDNVTASKEKTTQALETFTEAQSLLQQIINANPSANLDGYQQYLEKRIEAMQYAVASDDAILTNDKETASAQNDAYNQVDAAAVDLAKQLSDDPGQPIYDTFNTSNSSLLDTYATARAQAGSADAFLRDYLGTNSK